MLKLTHTHNINISCDDLTFGLVIDSNETSHIAFISRISTKITGSVVKYFKSNKSARKNFKRFYIVAKYDRPCFNKDYFIDCLCTLSTDNAINFEGTVAFDHRLFVDERWRNLDDLDLYTPPPLPHSYSPATKDFLLTFLLNTFVILLLYILFDSELNNMNACMHMMIMIMMMMIVFYFN